MIQEYTWELSVPGEDVDGLCDRLTNPVRDMLNLNRWVIAARIELDEEAVQVVLRMKGHDRWWIRKRAPFLISSILTRARHPVEKVRHTDIVTVPNKKKARFRTEDGTRVWEPADGSEPGPQLTIRPCRTCRDRRQKEKYWSFGKGWRTGPEAY